MRRSREHQGRGRSQRRGGHRHAARAHHDHDRGPRRHRGPAVRFGRHDRGGRGDRQARPASSSTASRSSSTSRSRRSGTHLVPVKLHADVEFPVTLEVGGGLTRAGPGGRPPGSTWSRRRPSPRASVVGWRAVVPKLSPGLWSWLPTTGFRQGEPGMATQRTDDDGRGSRTPAGRVPPHNLEAEEALLGAMLLSRDAVAAASEVVSGSDVFYRPSHAHIFDVITVAHRPGRRGRPDHGGRRAAPSRPARRGGRPVGPARPPGRTRPAPATPRTTPASSATTPSSDG